MSERPRTVFVVDVHRDNFMALWPRLHMAVMDATFVALDCGLSGLGSRGAMRARSVQQRFELMKATAQSRALLSLGISCFKATNEEGTSYQVQTFDILLFSTREYVVEPGALTFLDRHGFDFNKQARAGLRFTPGHHRSHSKGKKPPRQQQQQQQQQQQRQACSTAQEKVPEPKSRARSQPTIHDLFQIISKKQCPVLVHNGLLDLVFLYESLYTELPGGVDTFLADMSELLPTIFDTKVLAEYHAREEASYLEYLFHRCLSTQDGRNMRCTAPPFLGVMARQGTWVRELAVRLGTTDANTASATTQPQQQQPQLEEEQEDGGRGQQEICMHFAAHGHCRLGKRCPRAHDVVRVVKEGVLQPPQTAAFKRRQRRKRAKMEQQHGTGDDDDDDDDNDDDEEEEGGGGEEGEEGKEEGDEEGVESEGKHTPQDSANATGSSKPTPASPTSSSNGSSNGSRNGSSDLALSQGHRAGYDAFMTGFVYACYRRLLGKGAMQEAKNKLYLSSKPRPLLVHKSAYTQFSKNHTAIKAATSPSVA